MIVYRVENAHNPYAGRPRGVYRYEKNWSKLPSPKDDGINWYMSGTNVCATKSIRQFRLWWSSIGSLKKIPEAKVVMLKISPEYVKKGKHQVVIRRDKAIEVGTLSNKYTRQFHKESK